MAYYAVQNFVAVFDNLDSSLDAQNVKILTAAADSTSRQLLYRFADEESGLESIALWRGGSIPVDGEWSDVVSVEVAGFNCKTPVCVDILNGAVYSLPYRRIGRRFIFDAVPYYDSPIIICDKSLIGIEQTK